MSRLSVTNLFRSTLPVWGATIVAVTRLVLVPVSIHAPCVGSDECGGMDVYSL